MGPESVETTVDVVIAQVDPVEQERVDYERIQVFGSPLQTKFNTYWTRRKPIETKWLEDLRQYYGQYDPDVEQDLKAANSSQLFVNLTRPKTNTFAARMMDMLLPTDEKNWGISASPLPDIEEVINDKKPLVDPAGQEVKTADGAPIQGQDIAKAAIDARKEAAKRMEEQIDDRLSEAGYNAIQRKVIEQMAQLGTGVAEAPVQVMKASSKWQKNGGMWTQSMEAGTASPTVEYVDVWDFFPDMSSPDPKFWRDGFRRYYMTGKELRDRAKRTGFNKTAVRNVLRDEKTRSTLTEEHLTQLRTIQGITNYIDDRYVVLKYIGPLDKDHMSAAGIDVDDDDLKEYHGIVWLCDNVVLKVDPYFLDSGALPWSVCYCEKDTMSPFGWGIPRLMRGEQRAANASWRMMIDNGGLSTGPQTVMDQVAITPSDGKPGMSPRKTWLKNPAYKDIPIANVFGQFTIDSHQAELMNIFELATKLADETTMTPMILQGDQAQHITKTAQGMAMLNNNANIVQKRAVKLYDDNFTGPLITRMFEWEMMFNPRDDIKDDWCVIPKGASVLMEKELQSQTQMQFMQFKGSQWDDYFDWYKVGEGFAKNVRMADVVRPKQEVEQSLEAKRQAAAQAAQQGQGGDQTWQLKAQMQTERMQLDKAIHDDNVQLKVAEIAARRGISKEQVLKELALKTMDIDNSNKRFNAEFFAKQNIGPEQIAGAM